MTTLSTFQINQPPGTPFGTWDRSRRDIELYSVASEKVECEALEKAQSNYLWEMVSAPDGVSVTINNPTTHTCDFELTERGSYLIRLTVNAGAPNQSKTILFIGVAMEYTGYCLPAMNETNQDNSQSPFNGARGYEEKLNLWLRKLDEMAGGAVATKWGAGTILYVDSENGDDGSGDGSAGAPYQTIGGAASSIGTPADFAEFNTPLYFNLAPGSYTGGATMPYRREIFLTGGPATIGGTINWNYDVQYWYSEFTTTYIGSLYFQPSVVQGFKLTGTIQGKNAVADTSAQFRRVGISDSWVGCNIWNLDSGNSTNGQQTGEMVVGIVNCESPSLTSAYIGGQRESAMASEYANAVVLLTSFSELLQDIAGCVSFYRCTSTWFKGSITWDDDPATGSSPYSGGVGGTAQGFIDCKFNSPPKFGWDGAVGSQPPDVPTDSASYESMNTPVLDNGIEIVLTETAKGVGVDETQFQGTLDGVTPPTVQRCLEVLDKTGGDPAPLNTVWVDVNNGQDVVEAGKVGLPYQTIAYAVSQIGDAIDWTGFNTKWKIIVAPGTYSDALSIPKRRVIEIDMATGVEISGDIDWYYDLALWGVNPPQVYPNKLSFRSNVAYGEAKVTGNLEAKNDTPASGGDNGRYLHLDNIEWWGDIINEESGDASASNNTGTLNLVGTEVAFYGGNYPIGTGVIGGTYESAGGANHAKNVVQCILWDCQFFHHVYGVATFALCSNTIWYGNIDYDVDPRDPIGVPSGYGGNIGGTQAFYGSGFQDCYFHQTYHTKAAFGYDVAKLYSAADPVGFDEYSFNSMNTALYVSGGNYASYTDMALGYVTYDNVVHDGAFWVSSGGSPEANGETLKETYAKAAASRPNGNLLSTDNRATVFVPPGDYLLGKTLGVNVEFVDIVGMGNGTRRAAGGGFHYASVIIRADAKEPILQSANDVRLKNFTIQKENDNGHCLSIDASSTSKTVHEGLGFRDNGVATGVRAVRCVNSGFDGVCTECHTDLPGFLYNCDVGGRLIRCTADDYSFCAVPTGDPALDLAFSGYAEDCIAGNLAYGSTPVGGNVTVTGKFVRCKCDSNGYGGSYGGTGPYTVALTGAEFIDCDNASSGGLGSFGYCENGAVTISASIFKRCRAGDDCFGSADDGIATIATGTEFWDCEAGERAFGFSNKEDALFDGVAYRCIAEENAFGVSNDFLTAGKAGSVGVNANLVDCAVTASGGFGMTTTPAGNDSFLGIATRCSCDGSGFGADGDFGGTCVECFAGLYCFGGTGGTSTSGTLKRCDAVQMLGPIGVREGFRVEGGRYRAKLSFTGGLFNVTASTGGGEPKFWQVIMEDNATNYSIDATGGPHNIKVAHCMMAHDHDTALVNLIGTPDNVVDVNVR